MMRLFLFAILLFTSTLAQAQVNWFPAGAKWTIEWSAYGGWGYVIMEVLPGDTSIAGQTYRKVLISNYLMEGNNEVDTVISEINLFFEEDDKVYIKEGGNRLLYDFNAITGDTLDFMYAEGLSMGQYIVDSIGTIDVNGVNLRFQDIVFPEIFDTSEYTSIRVLEKVGSLNTHFLYYLSVIQPVDAPFYHLICYRDEEIEFFHYYSDSSDCDPVLTNITQPESPDHIVEIIPNPVTDFFEIKSNYPTSFKVIITDLIGNIIVVKQVQQDESPLINVSYLIPGLYILTVSNQKGLLQTAKMVRLGGY